MKNIHSYSYLCLLIFLAANLALRAQNESSIYLDSRDVAAYIRNVQEPYIDASKVVGSINCVQVFQNNFQSDERTPLVFPASRRLSIMEDGIYTVVSKLAKTDTVFVMGYQRHFITHESADTINLLIDFTEVQDSLEDAHILNSYDGGWRIRFGPTDNDLPFQAAIKLGYHVYFKQAANQIWQIPLDELQLTYAANPFMAKKIMTRPSIKALNMNVLSNIAYHLDWEKSEYGDFTKSFSKAYPWQAILDGDSILQLNQLFSFEDQRGSYRDQIISSEKALSLASQQINQTSRQGSLLDARTVAVGMSDFIAERAQEELNLTFFERFKTNMLDTNELSILFPKTRDLLVGFEISNYKTLLSHARTSFETDLANIGLNFPKILSLPKYQALQNDPNVFNLALIYSLADLAYKEYPVEDILLHSCQSLDLRNKELDKAINLRIIDYLIDRGDPTETAIKLNHLDTLSRNVVRSYSETESLIMDTYQALYDMSVRYNDRPIENDAENTRNSKYEDLIKDHSMYAIFLFKSFTSNNNDYLTKEQQYRISTYLSGQKFFHDLFDGYSEEVFEQEFTREKSDPKDNYSQGLAYVRQITGVPVVSTSQQKYQELRRYVDGAKTIEQAFFEDSKSDSTLFERYVSYFEKFRLLNKAFNLEYYFWFAFRGKKENNYRAFSGLEYLNGLIINKFSVFPFASRFESYYDYEDLKRDFHSLFLADFKKEITSNPGQIEKNLQRYMQLLEDQTKRLYLDNTKGNEQLGQLLLSKRDTVYSAVAKVEHLKRALDSLQDTRNNIEERYFDSTGFSKLIADVQNSVRAVPGDSLMLIFQEAERLTKQDTNHQKISLLVDEAEAAYQKAKDLYYQKMINMGQKWAEQHERIGANTASFLVPAPADHNPYLQQLAHSLATAEPLEILDEETTQHFKTLDSLMVQIEPAIAGLGKAQKDLRNYLDSLENQYCPDLVKAKRNAANLYSSMELSMHLLSAFRNPEKPLDSMFISDSVLIAVTLNKEQGITRSYDSLVVRKKYIADENFKLPGSRWITVKEFNALKNDPLQWDIFLGMLYERMRRVEDAPDFSAAGVALLANKFFDIVHTMDVHREQVRLKKATQQTIGFKDYYPFIKSSVDLFNTVINTPLVGTDKLVIAEQFEDIRKVSEISDAALSMYENIYVKNYGNAIRNAMSLMSIFTNSEYDPANPVYNSMLRSEPWDSAAERTAKKEQKEQNAKVRQSRRAINAVLTYGTFMADMIDAQTSEQVKNILKSATLPPGSSRIKREVSSNFTINSYLGGAVAYDKISEDLPGLQTGAIGASMSVPVGFTYSFSPDRIFKRGGSFSIHVPLIDLGAITAFRSNPSSDNYQIERLPEFTWKNLFAPGAFFIWNFRNSPFSFGAGGQIGPQLRQITDLNTMIVTSANSTRFPMVFFSVDVPFFNLHTGAKKIVVD